MKWHLMAVDDKAHQSSFADTANMIKFEIIYHYEKYNF